MKKARVSAFSAACSATAQRRSMSEGKGQISAMSCNIHAHKERQEAFGKNKEMSHQLKELQEVKLGNSIEKM
jgi:hypothetical protein